MSYQIARFLILCIFPLLTNVALSQTAPMYMLKFKWMSCADERDVVDLANAWSKGAEWMQAVAAKIVSGACTRAAMPISRVSSVIEKRTPAGRTYYCFDLLEPAEPVDADGLFKVISGEHLCAPPYMLTTVDAELNSRTGDFDLIFDNEIGASASCIEGGLVKLRKENGALFRYVGGLPWKRPYVISDVPAGQDVPKALRDGCKGVDVQ